MALTVITTNRLIASCGAVALSGTIKVVAEDMAADDIVLIYEETGTPGNYQPVPTGDPRTSSLTPEIPSTLFGGYGNYKFKLGAKTATGLVVGYAAA